MRYSSGSLGMITKNPARRRFQPRFGVSSRVQEKGMWRGRRSGSLPKSLDRMGANERIRGDDDKTVH
jgi:hypothetical protein